jgi:hypothetical protein
MKPPQSHHLVIQFVSVAFFDIIRKQIGKKTLTMIVAIIDDSALQFGISFTHFVYKRIVAIFAVPKTFKGRDNITCV